MYRLKTLRAREIPWVLKSFIKVSKTMQWKSEQKASLLLGAFIASLKKELVSVATWAGFFRKLKSILCYNLELNIIFGMI